MGATEDIASRRPARPGGTRLIVKRALRRRVLSVCELEAKERPAARRILGGHAASVRLCDLAHDREAQAGTGQRAGRCGSVKAVEHVPPVLRRDPGAVIAYAELAARERDVDARARCRPLTR